MLENLLFKQFVHLLQSRFTRKIWIICKWWHLLLQFHQVLIFKGRLSKCICFPLWPIKMFQDSSFIDLPNTRLNTLVRNSIFNLDWQWNHDTDKVRTKKESSSSNQLTNATKSSIFVNEAARTSVANDWTKSPCVSTSALTWFKISDSALIRVFR